jgi:ABC-type transport system substrate-binding protein
MKERFQFYPFLGLVLGCVLLLLLATYQLHSLEQRAVVQEQSLRALGEATDRLAGQVERMAKEGIKQSASAPASSSNSDDVDPLAKILHPEVENFLKPTELHWPKPGAKLDGVYKRGWPFGDPKIFNPIIANAAEVQEQITQYVDVYPARRNTFTNPDNWSGDLAWRVEITDDSKEFTLYLRRNVHWHVPAGVDLDSPKYAWLKGEHEVTAHDLVFAFDMVTSPQVENGAIKSYYSELESYRAVDDYTLVVRWKKKLYQSIENTLYQVSPLPRFIFEHNEDGSLIPKETLGLRLNQHWYNNKGYVGAGPYRLAKYEPGVKIELERNDAYYGDKPAIARILYPIYTDQNQTVLKLKANELTASRLQPQQYRREVVDFQALPKDRWPKDNPFLNGEIQCDVINLPSFTYLGWNTDRPLFADVRVRQALTYALNREGILKDVFMGLGQIARGPFLEDSTDLDPEVKPLPFDLTKAAALFDEAGWKDTNGDGLRDKLLNGKQTPFEFSLLVYSNSAEFAALANIFKEDLLKIGVKMNVESAEWSLMQKRMDEHDFDAVTGGWLMSWVNDPYQLWHSSQADAPLGSNRTGFRNKEADALIEKLRETFDAGERQRMMHALHRIIVESYNYTFLLTGKRPFCYHRELQAWIYSKVRPIEDNRPWSIQSN